MKKQNLLIVILLSSIMTACCEDKVIEGVKYEPYGLLNSEKKVDSVVYRVPIGPIVAGVVFSELIVPPIYIFGYGMYEPVSVVHKIKKQ